MRAEGKKRTILIITGGPGTGKSYAAEKIAEELGGITKVPYDPIKEKNFDRFGYDNKKQKDRLNLFSLEEFYLTLGKHMWLSDTIMTEYPFNQIHRERLRELIEENHYQVITVYLYGDTRVIYERGVERNAKEDRHRGHLTNHYHIEEIDPKEEFFMDAQLTYEEFCEEVKKKK